jgi:hypothetical protein
MIPNGAGCYGPPPGACLAPFGLAARPVAARSARILALRSPAGPFSRRRPTGHAVPAESVVRDVVSDHRLIASPPARRPGRAQPTFVPDFRDFRLLGSLTDVLQRSD